MLARAVGLEVLSRETGRSLHIELGGEPPLPDELDELYAKAQEGLILDIRWGRMGGPASR